MFDVDNNGFMSLQELMDGLTLLTSGSEFEKLCFLFEVYDVDGMMLLVLLYGCHHCYFSSTLSLVIINF